MNKSAELQAIIELHEPDLIAITEVKPKRCRFTVQECEIAIEGYDVFHNLEQEGRGIALFTKTTLRASMSENIGTNFEEAIFAECHSAGDTLRIGVIYRSPSSDNENNDNLCHLINEAMWDNPENLLILGDFNYKEIDWASGRCHTQPAHPAHRFLSACKNAFLIQNQTEPTRFRGGQEPSLLDLVLTNRDDIVNEISTEAGLGKSDHVTLIINLNWTNNKFTSERKNYHKADY